MYRSSFSDFLRFMHNTLSPTKYRVSRYMHKRRDTNQEYRLVPVNPGEPLIRNRAPKKSEKRNTIE